MRKDTCLLLLLCVAALGAFVSADREDTTVLSYMSFYDSPNDFFNFTGRCIFEEDAGDSSWSYDFDFRELMSTDFHLVARKDLLINLNTVITIASFGTDDRQVKQENSAAAEQQPKQAQLQSRKTKRGSSASLTVSAALAQVRLCKQGTDPNDATNCLPFAPTPSGTPLPSICQRRRPEPLTRDANCWLGPAEVLPVEVNIMYLALGAFYVVADLTVNPNTLTLFARNVPRGDWTVYVYLDRFSLAATDYSATASALCVPQAVMTVQATTFADVI